MTAISSLVGFFPLLIATGAGSASRWSVRLYRFWWAAGGYGAEFAGGAGALRYSQGHLGMDLC